FYEKTEPFFAAMIGGYHRALTNFMKHRWLAFILILISGVVIFGVGRLLQWELSPTDDRSLLRMTATAPEGSSYEYMENYMDNFTRFITDSVPEAKVILEVVAPSFSGSGAVNSGVMRIVLSPPNERKRSQQQIVDYVNRNLKYFPGARTF